MEWEVSTYEGLGYELNRGRQDFGGRGEISVHVGGGGRSSKKLVLLASLLASLCGGKAESVAFCWLV